MMHALTVTPAARRWEQSRAVVSHNFLKSELLPALAKWVSIVDGEVEDAGFFEYVSSTLVRRWALCSFEIVGLLNSYADSMSPAALLDMNWFEAISDSERQDLARFVDTVWRISNGVDEKLAECRRTLDRCNALFRLVDQALGTRVSFEALPATHVAGLFEACQSLTQRLSELGRQTRVLAP